MKTIRKWALAIIVIGVVVGVVGPTVYLTRRQITPTFSVAPSTLVAGQGANITFTVYGLEPNGVATIYFGDGHEANTTSTITYAYQNSGRYLVGARESVNGLFAASTFGVLQTIQVTPKVNASLAPLISIPTISFDVSRDPAAPLLRVSDPVYLYGGFLEPPSGTNVTIERYDWDFGNGATENLAANETSLKPAENPVITTYEQPGLYPVILTLVTKNSTDMAAYKTSIEQTVAVASAIEPYGIFLYSGIVPNPAVINVAENVPGGPFSFDPQVDYEPVGDEIVDNIFSTLLIYNGSSTTQFLPMAAARIPSVPNGGISADYKTYTFQIRSGLKFSNGDPLTAYDVWYSMVRDMLFVGGDTGTPGWILAQYLISGAASGQSIMNDTTDTVDFDAIMNALTYSNSSDTVTFKLVNSTIPQLFFTAIAGDGTYILDASWLEQVGAGITFTPSGFYNYQNQSNEGSFNLQAQWDPVSSGPYMIQSYVPGQSVTLAGNPGFQGVPEIPTPNNSVVIQWVKDPQTAYDLFTSGQADIVTWLPTNYIPLICEQAAAGKAATYETSSLTAYFFAFNLDVDDLNTTLGPQYHIPSDYFTNLDVREAFAYAFDYTAYIDQILGNEKYKIDFGTSYAGAIIPGLAYYVPPSELQNVPTYDPGKAKQLLQASGQYNTPINIPVIVDSGDTISFAAAQMWATALNSIDPNIVMNPIYLSMTQYQDYWNSIPISFDGWFADYAYPQNFVDAMNKEGGYYPSSDGWTVDYLNSTGHPDQAMLFAQMNSLIDIADSTTNATLAAQDYRQADQLAINLYMYVYLMVPNSFWIVKPYMNGYQGYVSYEENPILSSGGPDGMYFWWVKTCESTQACSGRSIGP